MGSAGDAGFRLLAEHLPDIVILAFDDQLDIWAATGTALRARGWTASQFLGRKVPAVGRPDDAAITEASCRAALRGEIRRFETNGNVEPSRLWVMQFVPIPGERDAIVGGMVLARDITDHRLAERQLQASRRQLAEAQRIARVGSWEWDLETDELTVSDELCRLFGLPLGIRLTMAQGVAEAIHPADRDRVAAHLDRIRDDPSPFELEQRIVRADGDVRTVLARGEGVVDEHGRVVASSAPTRTSPSAAGPTTSAAACRTGSTRPRGARIAAWPPTCTTGTSRAWPRSASSWSRRGCGSAPAARPSSTCCSGRSARTCRPR